MNESDWKRRLHENLARVRGNIADACQRADRDPRSVQLLAVTKVVSLEILQELVHAGVADIGESRVQQLVSRAEACDPPRFDWPETPGSDDSARPRWHMIGHLQRNKVRQLLPHARIIHSLDSERLARALDTHAESLDVTVDAFVEVNIASENSKEGVQPKDLPALLEAVAGCPHIRLRGLMTMAPLDPDPEHARPHFARLRSLLEQIRTAAAAGTACGHLSMGMSQDYMVAIEEGATIVRVGSTLFDGLPMSCPRAR